jgi:hypothetical protein
MAATLTHRDILDAVVPPKLDGLGERTRTPELSALELAHDGAHLDEVDRLERFGDRGEGGERLSMEAVSACLSRSIDLEARERKRGNVP